MTARKITVWIDEKNAWALRALKERDGIPEAEQIRRALTAWFQDKRLGSDGPRRGKSKDKKGGL